MSKGKKKDGRSKEEEMSLREEREKAGTAAVGNPCTIRENQNIMQLRGEKTATAPP